jgi:hypothetical protein
MTENISKEKLKSFVDSAGINNEVNEVGDCVTTIKGNSDFGYDVIVNFMVHDGWIKIKGFSPDLGLVVLSKNLPELEREKRANYLMLQCHHWNLQTIWPKAFVSLKRANVFGEYNLFINKHVSNAFVITNCILRPYHSVWDLFCALNKALKTNGLL